MKSSNPSLQSPVSSADPRVPLPVKVAAGAGEAAINVGVNLPKNFAFPIYNLALGVSPTLLGLAMLVPRFWDAVIDPVMGSISDNTRSRFGRRRPYMLIGALLSSLCVALMCIFPRGLKDTEAGQALWGPVIDFWLIEINLHLPVGDWQYAGWLLCVSLLFYTALTIFAVPYGALTMELTRNYEERTRVMSFRTFFTYLSGLLIGWLYAIAEWDIFKDADGQPDVVKGSYAVGIGLALLLLVVMLTPTIFVKEPLRPAVAGRRDEASASASAGDVKIGFWRGLKETLSTPAFLMIVAAYTIGFLAVIMVIGLGQYVNYYHVYGGDLDRGSIVQGWAHTLATLCGIAAAFAINRLAARVEKKRLLIGALSCSFVGGLLSWVLYSPDLPTFDLIAWVPGVETVWPAHPLSFSYALIWPGLAGLLIVSNSMIADVCDLDELKTGARREGMYWAVFNWIQKTAISIALLFSGVILDVVGFDAKAEVQSDDAIRNMRLAYLLVVCGGVLVSGVIVALIPLTRVRMEAVRAELDTRR